MPAPADAERRERLDPEGFVGQELRERLVGGDLHREIHYARVPHGVELRVPQVAEEDVLDLVQQNGFALVEVSREVVEVDEQLDARARIVPSTQRDGGDRHDGGRDRIYPREHAGVRGPLPHEVRLGEKPAIRSSARSSRRAWTR